jgi:Plasma-membrane choline transporter
LFSFVGVAASYGADALNPSSNSTDTDSEKYKYHGFVYVAAIVAGLSFACAGLGMVLLFCIPQFFIKVALIVTIVLAAVWMVFYFVTDKIVGGILSALFLVVAVWYTYAVWNRIPFATANLVTANTAVRANMGVTVYSVGFSLLGVLWAICWSVAYAGVSDATYSCDANNVCSDPKIGILIVLFIAFFFVQQVIQVGCNRRTL